jgi:iron complex outermembrane recepter protein
MVTKVRSRVVLGSLTFILLGPLAAWSDSSVEATSPASTQNEQASPGESAGDILGEIVVTAQKRSESLNRVGLTVTAFSGEELRNRGVSSVQDLSAITPGLSFAQTQANTPVYTLRGVGFNDSSLAAYPDVSVYVDQVPLPFPALTGQAGLDLERVEILKGPQGILFGTNATGGAINYVAAKPTTDFEVGGNLSVSRFNTLETEDYVSGPLADTLLARVAVKVESGGDWQHSDTRDDSLGKTEVFAGRLLIDWMPTPAAKFELNLNGWLNQSDPEAAQYIAFDPEHPALVQPSTLAQPFAAANDQSSDWAPDRRPRANDALYQGALRADITVPADITITSISSYIGYTRNDLVNADGVANDLISYTPVGSIHTFSQELRAANGGDASVRWTVGANADHSHVIDNDADSYPGSSSYGALGIFQSSFLSEQDLKDYAAFGNLDYDVAQKVTVKGGVRYSRNDRTAQSCDTDLGDGGVDSLFTSLSSLARGTPTPPLMVGQCFSLNSQYLPTRTPQVDVLDQSNVSWRVGIDYKITENDLLYANVTKGYKAGSIPSLSASTTTELTPVRQESVLDYEAGFKTQLLDRKLYLTGAAFFYAYNDKQVLGSLLDPVFGVEPVLINVPKSFVKGAETSLSWAPFQGFITSLSMTYLDTRVTDYYGYNAEGVTGDLAGSTLPFSPKWSGVFDSEYRFPLNTAVDGFVGGDVTGKSRQTTLIGANAEEYIDDYFLLDLRAGVASRDGTWRVSLWGKNVLDKYYWNNVIREPDNTIRYAGFPATFGLTVSYHSR